VPLSPSYLSFRTGFQPVRNLLFGVYSAVSVPVQLEILARKNKGWASPLSDFIHQAIIAEKLSPRSRLRRFLIGPTICDKEMR